MDNYDADQPRYSLEKRVRSRKDHDCRECKRVIKPGDYYSLFIGFYQPKQWVRVVTCHHCKNIREYVEEKYQLDIPFGMLFQEINEFY